MPTRATTIATPAARPGAPAPGGFTLIELLVVVAVIGVLIGALLPALGRAREMAKLHECLSNCRQITIAATEYSYDNDEYWPFVPLKETEPQGGAFGSVTFNSWTHGGKTTSDYWNLNFVSIEDRPLNPYAAPDLILRDQPGEGEEDPLIRTEVPLFRCPSDEGTFQRSFWGDGTYRDFNISSYDDVGTSYHLNVKWWFDAYPNGSGPYDAANPNMLDWVKFRSVLRNNNAYSPSRFVWSFEQNMDFVVNTGETREGDHGGFNKAAAQFMDGHVGYIDVIPGAADAGGYTLSPLPTPKPAQGGGGGEEQ